MCFIATSHSTFSQETLADSTKKDNTTLDTLANIDSTFKDSTLVNVASTDIKAPIKYKAKDSIVYDLNTKMMHLYNESVIDYDDIHIDAYYIDYDWTSSNLEGNQYLDEKDSVIGKPYLKQAGKEYFTKKIKYNFKSQKGKVYDIVTQENEGILHGHEVKRDSTNWFIQKAKFTTCNLENPHFHLAAKKLKLIPQKAIVTGPAVLKFQDAPSPLVLPFGIFPLEKGRHSGIILPQNYGFSPFFNLQGLGYYLAINDNFDLTLGTNVYLNSSFDFYADLRYNVKYKYNGNFFARVHRTFIDQDPDDPEVKANTPTQYSFKWIYNMDPKAHPTFNLRSNLEFVTAGYHNRSLNINQNRFTGQVNSNLNFTKRFRNSNFMLTGGLGYVQNLQTQKVSGDIGNLNLIYNGTPFKTKNNRSILNKINLNYNTRTNARFTNTQDTNLFTKSTLENLDYGAASTFNFTFTGMKLLKYLNVIPRLNYNEYLYFKRQRLSFENNAIVRDTSNGIFTAREFNTGVSLSTRITGIFMAKRDKKLKGIKHLMTPTVAYSLAPDFSREVWGFYENYTNADGEKIDYFPYLSQYGSPGSRLTSLLTFGLSNSIEGKFRKKSTDNNFSYINKMLGNINITSNYNFSADSNNLAPFNIGITNSSLPFISFNGGLSLNPYKYNQGEITKEYLGSEGNWLRMTTASINVNLNLRSTDLRKKVLNADTDNEAEIDYLYRNFYNYYDFESPWNINVAFGTILNNSYSKTTMSDTTILTHTLNLNNFDFNLTKKWKIGITSGYDFRNKQIAQTTISAIRDMHCWIFSVNYSPITNIGPAYMIEIRPKASILQDLKITRNRTAAENFF